MYVISGQMGVELKNVNVHKYMKS